MQYLLPVICLILNDSLKLNLYKMPLATSSIKKSLFIKIIVTAAIKIKTS